MAFSEKLNGYWEEGYHYYLEFRDDKMTLRRYDRVIELETTVTYDAAALDRGERTVITPANDRISSGLTGNMMREIHELRYVNGVLELETHDYADEYRVYTLKKVENSPFSHIVIRDDEFLEGLQGVWKKWGSNSEGNDLVITGNHLKWGIWGEGDFHVISYNYRGNYDPQHVYLVPADLTRDSFRGFTKFEVKRDMLTTQMMVYDMSVPTTVFAREDMLDKIRVPGSATRPAVNTMNNTDRPAPINFMGLGMNGFLGMMMPQPDITAQTPVQPATQPQPDVKPDPDAKNGPTVLSDGSTFCPDCGTKLGAPIPKFCWNCGRRIRE